MALARFDDVGGGRQKAAGLPFQRQVLGIEAVSNGMPILREPRVQVAADVRRQAAARALQSLD